MGKDKKQKKKVKKDLDDEIKEKKKQNGKQIYKMPVPTLRPPTAHDKNVPIRVEEKSPLGGSINPQEQNPQDKRENRRQGKTKTASNP